MPETATQPKLLLTIQETATALNLSRRSIARLLAGGELRAVRIGGAVRIPVAEVKRLASEGSR
jgi:excisionase family DNA binding protein